MRSYLKCYEQRSLHASMIIVRRVVGTIRMSCTHKYLPKGKDTIINLVNWAPKKALPCKIY